MRYTVYRSLDRPSSFLGIKGRFMVVFGVIAGGFALLGLFLGLVFGSGALGMILLCFGLVSGYITVLVLQGRMSVRQLTRFLASRKYPEYIKVGPKSLIGKVDILE